MGARGTALTLALVLAASCAATPADYYDRGRQAANAGDWERARTEFQAARNYQDAPERAMDALLAEAKEKETSGDLAGAIALYKQAGTYKRVDLQAAQLEGTKTVLDVLYSQMTASAASGQWDKALGLSKEILDTVPGYRDVGSKRAQYLEQMYATASASLDRHDVPQALKLLTMLVAAEPGYRDAAQKLAAAQAALKRPLPGAYPLGQVLRDGEWKVTLQGVLVQPDGRLTVSVVWANDSAADRAAQCSADRGGGAGALLIFADGTRSIPAETSCSVRTGDFVPPTRTYTESATFPPIADGTKPFSVSWYGVGTSGDIVLVTTGQGPGHAGSP